VVHGEGRVDVGGEEDGAAAEVLQRVGQLEVVDVEVEAGQDAADVRVEEGAVREALPVGGGDVPAEGGVGPAEEGDVLGAELVLDAGFAEDEDLVFRGGELQDARDVNGRGVGGPEDLFYVGGDAEGGELFEVFLAGLGGVVCYEDDLLSWSGSAR
jgi:hypothetical protein